MATTPTNVIFRWNGTDASQFTQVSGSGMLTASTHNGIGQVASAIPALKMIQADANTVSIWTANVSLPRRYVVSVSTIRNVAPNSGSTGVVVYYQDNTHYVALSLSGTSTGYKPYAQDGAGTKRIGVAGPSLGFNSNVAPFVYSFTVISQTGSSAQCLIVDDTPLNWDSAGPLGAFGSGSLALTDVDWAPTSTMKAGIILNGFDRPLNAGLSGSISEFVIMKHPMDW